MPRIIPITELRNTKKIAQVCDEEQAPVFITSNGYNRLVIMNDEVYNKYFVLADVYQKLAESEEDFKAGRVRPAEDVFQELKEKYGF